jgi:hypothetical protein
MTHFSRRVFAFSAAAALLLPAGVLAQDAPGTPTPPKIPPPPEVAQPAYSVLRIDDKGIGRAYRVWEEWVPQVVATPDGGAWVFFTAQARADEGYGPRRLFASRFNPTLKTWESAKPLGNEATQFSASAGVDNNGIVHVVYSERALAGDDTWSKLVYQRLDQDVWSEPALIAPDDNAGHQMLATLTIDAADGLHVIWRDQRLVDAELRNTLPVYADLLSSDLVGGAWSTPVPVSVREAPDLNPAWPRMVADKNRLVAIWSLYQGTTPDEMKSAASVQWSVRDLEPGATWSQPQTLFVRESGDAGGRLIDMAADPRGGVAAIFGLFKSGVNDLYVQRLEPEADAWSDPRLVASGDFGFLPTTAIARDGTMFVVFNNGRNRDVDIGGLKIAPDGTTAGPVTLTPGEGGVTARANITLDRDGIPWIVYMQQPVGATNVAEIQTARAPNFSPPS